MKISCYTNEVELFLKSCKIEKRSNMKYMIEIFGYKFLYVHNKL